MSSVAPLLRARVQTCPHDRAHASHAADGRSCCPRRSCHRRADTRPRRADPLHRRSAARRRHRLHGPARACSIFRKHSASLSSSITSRAPAARIGSDIVAKAAPDGYTFGIATSSSHAAAPVFRKDLPYDPVKSYTAVTMIGTTSYILIGGPAAGAKDCRPSSPTPSHSPARWPAPPRPLHAGLPADPPVRADRGPQDDRRACTRERPRSIPT